MKLDFKPGKDEVKKVRKLVKEGVNGAEEVLKKEKNLEIGIAWTEEKFVKNNMGGVSGMAWNPEFIEIKFNSEVEGWEENVKSTAAHEFGHSWFYEKIGHNHNKNELLIWQYVLDEALTQNLVGKIYPESVEKWALKHSGEDIEPYWNDVKDELDRVYSYPDPLYINKTEGGYPNWLGYSLSYLIGKKILEKHSIDEFPDLSKEDVVKAGNEIFGNNQ